MHRDKGKRRKRRADLALRVERLEQRELLAVSVAAQPPLTLMPDIANLSAAGPAAGAFDPGGDQGHIWSNRPIQGQTFTTGDNPSGYALRAVTLQNEENTINGNVAGFTVRVGSVSGNTFTQLASETANNSVSYVPNDYITFGFTTPVELNPNTVYGFEWDAAGSGFTTWNNVDTNYPEGQAYSSGGGGVPNDNGLVFNGIDRVFHVDLEAIVPPALQVASSTPAAGAILGAAPVVVTINFNVPIETSTLQAGDLTVDGNPATAVAVIDEDTVEFTPPAGISLGAHNIALAAGAIETGDGLVLEPFAAAFTVADVPQVSNAAATNITPVSAVVGGSVESTGGDIPQIALYFGDEDGGTVPSNWDNLVTLGAQSGVFSTTLQGLQPGGSYYYRVLASNVAGDAWAARSDMFTTQSASLPAVINNAATSVTSSSAILNGEVTATGGQPPRVTIYYGDEDGGANPAAWDQSIPLGPRTGVFSAVLTGLDPLSTYFFRAEASNDAGGVWAPDSSSFTTTELVPPTVVINEIHYDPADDTSPAEFIELFNAGDQTQDLSGWRFDDGVQYTFANGVNIPPGEYLVVAEDPAEVQAVFGADALGPWTGSLNNDGERVRLRNQLLETVDEVDYRLGFPWPTVGMDPGHSIELINAGLDNDLGGSWRSSAGDPGPEQTFFVQGSQWRYFKGTQEPSAGTDAWRQIGFDDSQWFTGAASIGYGDGHVLTNLADMRNTYSTVYFRKEFDVANLDEIASLLLEAQFDDGINVWINGAHVASSNVTGPELPYTGTSTAAGENVSFRQFSIPNAQTLLQPGANVIAVQLLNGSLGGSSDAWFDARLRKGQGTGNGPTPGLLNNAASLNAAPQMRQVDHSPLQPQSGQEVVVTMKVTDPDGVAGVALSYQLVDPGAYIRLTDAAYQTDWTTVNMVDNGLDGDAVAGDDVYTAVLPGALQVHRRLVRYRVTANDALGAEATVPYADDPQPNFAYFVYDGVPDWTGSLRPGVAPAVTYPSEVMQGVATYHMIADATDINNSQYNNAYNLVQFPGTIVYDGVVYDHMLYRNRGRASTYQVGKNKWKFNFNTGHALEARDDYGHKYDVAWDKINVLPGTNPWWRNNASTDGTILFEPVAFKLYELAGTPSPKTSYFQLRVIDAAAEASPTSQYEGDNWGLYIAIEQPEREFLDLRGLPDGNIYNMHGVGGATQRSQGSELPTDRSDLSAFVNGYKSNQPQSWWEDNLNFDSYFAWNAINLAAMNNDLRPEENVNYYHNQENGQWYTVPWDLDLSFEDAFHLGRPDTQWDSIQNVFNQHPAIRQLYQNRVRELGDLLLGNGDAGLVVQEFANVLTKGAATDTLVEANQALWDYHPRKRKAGIWYANFNPALLPQRSFAGLTQYMESFLGPGGYGYNQMLSKAQDASIPATPLISYAGSPGFASDGLTFQTSAFSDPQGANTFGAIEWRVAEAHHPGVANYDPSQPYIYEMEGSWESGELTVFADQITVPGNSLQVGHTYRARVRMQDNTGRYGHWSQPIEFVVSPPQTAASADNVVISEINYNPAEPTPVELAADPSLNNDDFEFIEFTNVSDQVVSLNNVKFDDGGPVVFSFDEGSIHSLQPQQRVLVVRNQAAFELRYGAGAPIAGQFADGGLSNSGELVSLLDASNAEIASFEYNDRLPWPIAADGYGFTLVLDQLLANPDYENPFNWRASGVAGGSPGGEDVASQPAIVINEVLTHTDAPQVDAIELFNPTSETVDIGGWFLSDDHGEPMKFVIPAGTVIPAGQWVVILEDDDADPLTTPPAEYFGGVFSLSSTGDEVMLSSGDGARLNGYTHGFEFGAAENGRSYIRHVDSTGYQHLTAQSGTPGTSLGQENAPFLAGAIVFTEIHYNPNDSDPNEIFADEFVEIRNATNGAVALFDAQHPENTWRIDGLSFSFPQNTQLAAGEIALVVSLDPQTFRARYQVDPAVQIFGPYPASLDDGGERIAIQRPDTPDLQITHYIDVDVVRYNDRSPWPIAADGANGDGSSLKRIAADNFGSDPISWFDADPSPGEEGALTATAVIFGGGDLDPPNLSASPQPVTWQQQRSQFTSLTIQFNEPILASAGDLELVNLGINAPVDADLPVVIGDDQIAVDGKRLTIRFDPASMLEGVYRLQVAPTVQSVTGLFLDGNGDGVAGDAFIHQGSDDNRFHVLQGDWNGDSGVTIFDFPTFAYWFGQSVPVAPSYVDLNGDGGITIFDFPRFADRFASSVIYPAALTTAPGGVASSLARLEAVPRFERPGRVADYSSTKEPEALPDRRHALALVLADWAARQDWAEPTAESPSRGAADPLQERDALLESESGDELLSPSRPRTEWAEM